MLLTESRRQELTFCRPVALPPLRTVLCWRGADGEAAMKKYQLIQPPGEGWRGRLSVIAQILRNVFRPPEPGAPELQPFVEQIDELVPPKSSRPLERSK